MAVAAVVGAGQERRIVGVLMAPGAKLSNVVGRIGITTAIEVVNLGRVVADLTDTGIIGLPVTGPRGLVGEIIDGAPGNSAKEHNLGVSPHPFAMSLVTGGAGSAVVAGPGATVAIMRINSMAALAEGIAGRGTTGQHVVVGRSVVVCRRCCMTGFTRVDGVSGIKGRHAAVTKSGKGGFAWSLTADRGQCTTCMTGFAFNGRSVVPVRLAVVAGGHAVRRAVTGVTDYILVVGHKTECTVDMVSAAAVIGMAGIASQLHAVPRGSDVFVMSGTERSPRTRCNPTGAGVAVLMTGTAGAGCSNIPVRSGAAMTGHRTSSCRSGVASPSGKSDIDDTVDVLDTFSTNDQSGLAGGGIFVANIAAITLVQVLDMTGGVFTHHISTVIAVTGITGGDAPFGATPDRARRDVVTGRVVDTAATIGVAADAGATTITGGGVNRIQTTASGLDDGLERTGRSEDILEAALVVGSNKVIVMTVDAAKVVTAGRTRVRCVRRSCFVFVNPGRRIVK